MRPFSRHSAQGRILLAIGLGALVLGASGCTRVRTHQGYQVDKLLVDSVQPGIDNRASVEGTLGRPTFTSQFGEQEWYYISRSHRGTRPQRSAATVACSTRFSVISARSVPVAWVVPVQAVAAPAPTAAKL